MIRNFFGWETDNIANQLILVSKVCRVGFLSPRIPLASEYGLPARRFKSLTDSPDASKKVDESERCVRTRSVTDSSQDFAQCRLDIEWQRNLAVLPPRNGFSIHVQRLGKHTQGEMLPSLH